MRNPHVLIVASDPRLCSVLVEQLTGTNCPVQTAFDCESAAEALAGFPADIVLIDHSLPNGDALDVCRVIRQQLPAEEMPLLILVPEAHRNEVNQLRVIQPGKGAEPQRPQLIRFVNSLVEPGNLTTETDQKSERAPERIAVGGLTIDRKRHQADVDGRDLNLTLTEFRIIWALSLNPGMVVSRKMLAESCCEHAGNIQERTIDAHIRAIRHKLKNRADLVETVRGVGYRFTDGKPHSETVEIRKGQEVLKG
jgi:two-component system phosphate regulon response regulator PhoB